MRPSQNGHLDLDFLGTRFSIVSEDARWIPFLEQLWQPFAIAPAIAPRRELGERIRISAHGDGWRFDFFGRWANAASDPWQLANALRNALFTRVLETNVGFVALHAAAVARAGSALLLPGPPGAGKTTLTLELLERGWTYLSDDLAPISASSGLVHPVPKPLHVKDPARWDLWRPRWDVPEWVGPPVRSFLVPVSGFDVAGEPLPVRRVVFPDYRPGARLRLTRLGAALGVARCAENARSPGPRGRQSTLPVLARVLGPAEAWAMTYGSSSEAADQLAQEAPVRIW